jgi:hypothetical protein
MPTMRHGYWKEVRRHMEQVMEATPELKLFWMPVIWHEELEKISEEDKAVIFGHHAPRWILPVVIHAEPGMDTGEIITRKNNAGNEAYERQGFEGWVSWWSDDNLLPRNIGKRMLAHKDKRVIVFSHKRGQHAVGPIAYETSDLIAAPENMEVTRVSGEQFFIHTTLIPGWRFPYHQCGDGLLIKALSRMYPNDFAYEPDFFTPFNAIEPGRWDADKLKECIEQP